MNLDKNQLFPNQFTDSDPTECVGISVSDVVGNIFGIPMSPDFSYAAGFNVAGQTPSTAGEDPAWGIDGAIAFGCLPASDEEFTALSQGEQFVMNFQNYSLMNKQVALRYAQNGAVKLKSFDEIWNWLQKGQSGVVLPLQWYQSFNAPDSQGFLPQPGGQMTEHCTATYDTGTLNGKRYLVIKPWEGKQYGENGYCKITQDIFNKVFFSSVPAYGFDPTAIRWISLLWIAAKRFPFFLSFIPSIIKSNP